MSDRTNVFDVDKLRGRIRALRAKTMENGCTEAEALAAAAKAAELLDRYDLSLTDAELQDTPCETLSYEPRRRKRIPLEDCIGAIAYFCDCRVWREKAGDGGVRYVFFGLRADIEVAVHLAEIVDATVRDELGRFKTGPQYAQFRHNERHLANASFALGMIASIGDKLHDLKERRSAVRRGAGRDLVVFKKALVDAEYEKLNLTTTGPQGPGRLISMDAYGAGEAAGSALRVDPAIAQRAGKRP
jgi:hypothetical protein